MSATRESFLPSIKCSECQADVEISLMGDHVCAQFEPSRVLEDFPMPKNADQRLFPVRLINGAVANNTFLTEAECTPSNISISQNQRPGTTLDGKYADSILAPKSPTSNGSHSVLARMDTIAPGPFGVGGHSREKPPDMLPAVAASFSERESYKTVTESKPASPLRVSRDNRHSQEWLQARGTIRFGFEDLDLGSAPELDLANFQDTGFTQLSYPDHADAGRREIVPMPRDPYQRESNTPRLLYGHSLNHSQTVHIAASSGSNRPPNRSNIFPDKLQTQSSSSIGMWSPPPGGYLPSGATAIKPHLQDSLTKALPPAPLQSPHDVSQCLTTSSRPQGDSRPVRNRSPSPVRPRSPPPQQRPGLRTGTPPITNNYVEMNFSHSATLSTSSTGSSLVSGFSRSDSSTSSPPISDISVIAKKNGSKHPQSLTQKSGLVDGLIVDLHSSMTGLSKNGGTSYINNRQQPSNSPEPKITRLDSLPSKVHDPPSLGPSFGLPPPKVGLSRTTSPTIQQPIEYQRSTQPKLSPETKSPNNQLAQLTPLVSHSRSHSKKPSLMHKRTATSKGFCRGCDQPIVGKSISSADGRLTGRYHKNCFVCQTCRQPFESAEFYVLDNKPFCERHYHQLNRSLCRTCDKGIEGPCLETERRERFHPRCFQCSKCRIPLGDDYFEINGRPYCQRDAHAYSRARQTPDPRLGPNNGRPSLNPNVERRKTRLMMMGPNANGLGAMGGMDGTGSLVGLRDMDLRMPKVPVDN